MTPARKLLFAVVPLLATCAVGEAGARLLGAAPCAAISPAATGWETMVGDPRYLWKLEPERVYESPAGTTSTNAVGLRTALLPTDPKAPDERRVAVTGDSSVFGWGQPDGQTYAEQLETGLDASFPGHRVRVVNLGVPGYSTEQTLRLLADLGWSYEPDLVVVHNIFSDANIDVFRDRDALALADPDGTAVQRLVHQSRLYCAVYMPYARFQAGLNQETNRVLMPGQPPAPEDMATLETVDQFVDLSRVPLDDYLDNLEEIRTQATARGAALMLAPLAQEWDVGLWSAATPPPTEGQVLPWHAYREAQAAWAERAGVPRVDLPAAFAADTGQAQRLFIDPVHPSAQGATVMARALVTALRDQPELLGLTEADVGPMPRLAEPVRREQLAPQGTGHGAGRPLTGAGSPPGPPGPPKGQGRPPGTPPQPGGGR